MDLILRGLETKTHSPYLCGWRLRLLPTLGHLPPALITAGAVDRAVHHCITDQTGLSTIKSTLAILVRTLNKPAATA